MPNCPAKFFSFFLIATLFSFSISGFCAQNELTALQKQARIYRDQGWQLQKEGNIDEALSYYQKAIVLDPNYAVAYNDLGIILESRGQIEEAEYMYLKAIEVAPDYPNSYSNLALLYESERDYINAVLYWIKRLTLGGPHDSWAATARKRLEEIAQIAPEAYQDVTERYDRNIQMSSTAKSESASPSVLEFSEPQTREISKISLFTEDEGEPFEQNIDNKTLALNYLARAKESFAKGKYVSALKDATVAEYLDSSNAEISAFVEKVRKKILH